MRNQTSCREALVLIQEIPRCLSFRKIAHLLFPLAFCAVIGLRANAEPPANAVDLFPAETQGLIHFRNLPKLVERWESTQFGSLAKVDGMQEFWHEQQKEIDSRLADAGWQLNIPPLDVYAIAAGEVAIGWIDKSTNARKPYAIGLAIFVKGNQGATKILLRSNQ